jgi:site-specific DNA-methyltransferase (adenine-specific)
MVNLMLGDCLEKMKEIPDSSVDMILADPPYGTTACKWDSVIDLEKMWEQLKRIIKPNGAIVMTASQPFTTILINSNIKAFKYNWVWDKKKSANFQLAKYQPMKVHEDVCVFSFDTHNYYPVMTERDTVKVRTTFSKGDSTHLQKDDGKIRSYTHKHPKSILEVSNADQRGRLHPTQKPVALMKYLIKTYTNESETVLDFTMGSGTTGVACANLSRNFIGIEMDENYFNIAKKRIEDAQNLKEK